MTWTHTDLVIGGVLIAMFATTFWGERRPSRVSEEFWNLEMVVLGVLIAERLLGR